MKKLPNNNQSLGTDIESENLTIKDNIQIIITKIINIYSPKSLLLTFGFFGLMIGSVSFIFIPKETNNYNNQSYDNSSNFLINNPPAQLPGQNFTGEIQKKDAEKQVIIYQKEVETNPNSAVVYTNLGEAKRRAGDLESAEKAHKKALQLNPNLVEAKLGQALVEQDKGNVTQAKQEIQDVLSRGDVAAAYFYLGEILFNQKPKNLQGAEAAYRKAVELEPKNIDYKLSLALAFVGQKKLEEAVSEINEAIRIKPNSKLAYLFLGMILTEQNKLDDAISAYRTFLKIHEYGYGLFDGFARTLLVNIFYEQGKVDAAISELKSAIRASHFEPTFHESLGKLLILQGANSKEISKIKEGISELKHASELYRFHDKLYRSHFMTDKADEIDKYLNSLKNLTHHKSISNFPYNEIRSSLSIP